MGFGNDRCKEIVENICPYCNEKLIMNKRSFANHVRWCKKNPRYEEIKEKCILKLKSLPSRKNKYIVRCEVCNQEYTVECTEHIYSMGKYKKTCCDKCAKILTSNKTNKELKNKKICETFKEKPNTFKTFVKVCKYCGKEFETISKNKNKSFCDNLCYRRYIRLGKKLKSLYKSCCKFNFSLNSYPEEFDFSLIERYGWYKAKNRGDNLNGISRDHIYSRDKGFENLLDPYIISHPANCQLLKHNDNASKNRECGIKIEELIEKIKMWNQKYGEYPNTIDYKIFENSNITFKRFEDLMK